MEVTTPEKYRDMSPQLRRSNAAGAVADEDAVADEEHGVDWRILRFPLSWR